MSRRRRGAATPLLLLAPVIACVAVFYLGPILFAGFTSFQADGTTMRGAEFVGAAHYRSLLADPRVITGAPAWLYVNRRMQDLRVPIQGWFGNERQFDMGPQFEPAEGIRKFQIASPGILGLRAVRTSFAMIEEAGMPAIGAKAARGTHLMIDLYDAWLAPLGFGLLTPRDPHLRGDHITITHPDARQIAAAMRTLTKTIPDFRMPDGIRLAISPLPTSYTEVWDGLDRLRRLVESERYREIAMSGTVT